MSEPNRILFVCLGNICRSPMAEGVFRHVADQADALDRFETDSAGLGDWHVGQAPDGRAQAAALHRGIDISGQRARQVERGDFDRYDLIVAMDRANLTALNRLAPAAARRKIKLFMDFAPNSGAREVPDPFFGEAYGFDHALDLIEAASAGLLESFGPGPGGGQRSG